MAHLLTTDDYQTAMRIGLLEEQVRELTTRVVALEAQATKDVVAAAPVVPELDAD